MHKETALCEAHPTDLKHAELIRQFKVLTSINLSGSLDGTKVDDSSPV